MSPTITPDALDRANAAMALVEKIKLKLAAGATFKSPKTSSDYADIRDRLFAYRTRTIISPKTLQYLQDIEKGLKGRKK